MKEKMRKLKKISLGEIIIGIVLIFMVLIILVPVFNIIAKSLSDAKEVAKIKGWQIWPQGFSLENYKIIFSSNTVITAFMNSLFITVVGTGINIILTATAAYVMTRPELPGKRILMVFFIIMMIFEPSIVQEYFVMKDFNLLDNVWSMVLYNSVNVYYLILLMRFFEETPLSLLEAAKIDGAGEITVFFKVFLPLNRIPIMTVGMFYAVARWNEYYRSSIFLSSRENTVLQTFLRQFVVDGDTSTLLSWGNLDLTSISVTGLKAATIIVVMVPILALYPIILKYYTSGVLDGGIKE